MKQKKAETFQVADGMKGGEHMALPYSRTIIGALPWYSVLVVGGIVLAIALAAREEKRLGLPKDTAVDLALAAVPMGIIGARLYYVAMSWSSFAANPLSVLYVWEGGLAIYGGVIGGAAGVWLYARRKNVSFAQMVDLIAPGLLLAQALGRWGNYFNMEAYGPEIVNEAFQFFPFGVLIPGPKGYEWHMATFFYESMWNLAGFAVLWGLRKRQKHSGNMLLWYLVIYGSGRFIIEQLRQDSLYIGGLRASQWLSLLLCAASAVVLLWRSAGGKKRFFSELGCAALWMGRWFCLKQPFLYGLLILIAGVVAIWLLRNKRSLWLLAAMLMLDAIGLAWSLGGGEMAGYFHTLMCSFTLPGMLIALCTQED